MDFFAIFFEFIKPNYQFNKSLFVTGWETMDQSQDTPFTDEEFKAYEMQRMREIQGMINRGVVPEGYPYYGGVPPGAPIHPQLGMPGQQPYMQGHQNMPVHPGQVIVLNSLLKQRLQECDVIELFGRILQKSCSFNIGKVT